MLNENVEKNENSIESMKKIINEDNQDLKVDDKELILIYTKNSIRTDRLVILTIIGIEGKERKKKNSLFSPIFKNTKN